MKKQYMNPTMEIVKIGTPQLMAGSPVLGGEYGGGTTLSRDMEFDTTVGDLMDLDY